MINQAVILCGGAAALEEVGGAPFLDRLLFEVGRYGIRRILLLAGTPSDRVRDYAHDTAVRARFGLDFEIMAAPAASGTGGALFQARNRLDEHFLLLDGNAWFAVNPLDLAARLLAAEPAVTGAVAMRQHGEGVVSGGIGAFRRRIVDVLAPVSSLERDVFPRLGREGALIGFVAAGYHVDIGTVEGLARARAELVERAAG
jgi:D-glycero-D-manno-heptose 1,7-bisphosphate phosphatase